MHSSLPDVDMANAVSPHPRRVFMLGATGTIGRATVQALVARGHKVVCLVRHRAGKAGAQTPEQMAVALAGAELRFGDVTDAASLARDGFRGETFDVLVSCLASRTGTKQDAWAIDHRAHQLALAAAKASGIRHMVLLSAICVQKPRLDFQHAKLAFERELMASGLNYSIVRPTAYFKSLSGQVERVRRGQPFLLFGNGRKTACKPISDRDLGRFMAECLDEECRWHRILPIGGPGSAITPREQGEILFAELGLKPKFRSVPLGLLATIRWVLAALGRFSPALAQKAELAGIGLYYASESMLVWDEQAGRYDAAATPSTGTDTLAEHYARLIRGEIADERGDHAVF